MSNSRPRGIAAVLLVGAAGLAPPSAVADQARDLALGRHLARECTSCHTPERSKDGIPSIVGLPSEILKEKVNFYRNDPRSNAAMRSVAQSLSDDELRAVAVYFSSLAKQ